MRRARFVGIGAAWPERVVPNAELEARLGLEPGWIEGRTGVRERRVLGPGASLAELAERASRDALGAAGLSEQALDAVVVATTSGEHRFPSLACEIHGRLGLSRQPALDVAAACAGFPYALTVADQGIRVGDWDRVLVVGADALSRACDPSDRDTSSLFGDGAGAAVLAAEEGDAGILATRLAASGALGSILVLPAGVRRADELGPGCAPPWMRMRGAEVFRFAVEQLVSLSREALAEVGVAASDLALLVPHQANLRIIRMMASQLGVDEARVAVEISRFGNTSAASIPIALREALHAGRVAPGDLLLLNAVGGGMTAGAMVVRW